MEQVIVGRLRVRPRGSAPGSERSFDPLLIRLRAAHLLETANLMPPRLPPAAILCIRSLSDPLPGALDLSAPQVAPDRAWQAALTERLDALAAHAERPVFGRVNAGASAVLFADPSEMLACLALDWLAGQLLNHWWWRHLTRSVELRASVARAWITAPEAVPAALARLDAAGAAVAFVANLTHADVVALLQGIAQRWRLPWLAELAAAEPVSSISDETAAALARDQTMGDAGVTEDERLVAAPWRARLAPEGNGLAAARQVLLGVALSLARAPQQTRSAAFGDAALAWRKGVVARQARVESLSRQVPSEDAPFPPRVKPAPQPDSQKPDPQTAQAAPAAAAAQAESTARLADHESSAADATSLSASADGQTVETAFGGIFYLLNVAIDLGYYSDFSQPEDAGLPLSPWRFLALIGRALIGEALAADPVWSLLAWLDGARDAGGTDQQTDWGLIARAASLPAGEPSDEWVTATARAVAARLLKAFRDRVEPAALVEVVLAYRGHVHATATAVDVMLRLDELDIAVRLAGLDRDPGWLPAAGRTIRFHYE